MSESWSESGSGTTAQSEKISKPSCPHFGLCVSITKQEDAVLVPCAVFTIVSPALSISAVEESAPETIALAFPK